MRTLRWQHRGWFARKWDLMEGDRVVATLAQKGWGFNAELDHAGRRYNALVTGFLRWRFEVHDEGGAMVNSMAIGWRGQGYPTLADGRRLRWDAENWWGTRWTLDDPTSGVVVAKVHMDAFLKLDARIELQDGAPRDDVLVPLLAVTWLAVIVTAQAAATAGGG